MSDPIHTLDAARAMHFHRAFASYQPTPLTRHDLHGQPLWVKDETNRMRLGAFKALGGVYAVATLIAREMGLDDPDPEALASRTCDAADMTFVCASAGNHGLAVAEGARRFGAGCRIHLSDTVPEAFSARLRDKGAEVVRSGSTYEESIAAAIADAQRNGAVHLADGAWPGYTEPPRLVMEGYTLMAEEMRESFERSGDWPSDVYLQAGVGGLAGAVAYMIRKNWAVQPRITVVEPDAAPCLKASMEAEEMTSVTGPVSIMGRLDCKEPSLIAFGILRETADRFVTVSDEQAQAATETADKLGFATSPSGAAGLAALLAEGAPTENPLVIFSETSVQDD